MFRDVGQFKGQRAWPMKKGVNAPNLQKVEQAFKIAEIVHISEGNSKEKFS